MNSLEELKQIILDKKSSTDDKDAIPNNLLENSLSQILELSNDLNETYERLEFYERREQESQTRIQQLINEIQKKNESQHPFVSPNRVLNSELEISNPELLKEALRNALSQISRLHAARKSQLTNYDALQRKYEDLNGEMNATVNALRNQRHEFMQEKKLLTTENARLRTQIANNSLRASSEEPGFSRLDESIFEKQLSDQRELYERQLAALRAQVRIRHSFCS
ncbi:hypothetical protein Ciccas_001666 [Cichlidogyrus casuarinus]|uniref:Uncharacterized protein n=1 Tax=Cichlidogyrus casuarinus TaxID=1844966 RepID=A0ABD2QJD6_9PLAT